MYVCICNVLLILMTLNVYCYKGYYIYLHFIHDKFSNDKFNVVSLV